MNYCTRDDIEALFDAESVKKWADLDGSGDADKIAARIAMAIEWQSAYIDDRLRGGEPPAKIPRPFPEMVLSYTEIARLRPLFSPSSPTAAYPSSSCGGRAAGPCTPAAYPWRNPIWPGIRPG